MKIIRFLQWSGTDRKLFLEALFFMFVSKIGLMLFSFKKIVKYTKSNDRYIVQVSSDDLKKIKLALGRAEKLAFWKNVCLVQSIAARYMLNRRKITSELKFGVKHNSQKKVIAHAWVISRGFEVVNKGDDYNELISL